MKSDMENKEWLDDHMQLKQVNPENPFTVPSGYFDELAQQVTSHIRLSELKDNGEGFAIPENYFEELSSNIQGRIAIEEFTAAQNEAFSVPEGYFDNLQQQINARILVEEALAETEENFTVPAGYFDKLTQDILNKTVNEQVVKRKGVVRSLVTTVAFKYAAAACFALVIGGGILLNQSPNNPVNAHNNSFLHKQVSTISVSDIESYLQQDVDANDTQHAVIDEGAPVDDASLNNALQGYTNDNNQ